jgi:hypothetical protein
MHGPWGLKFMTIEFNNNILYEEGDEVDEDEAELFEKRLKRPLFDLKIRDLAIIQVQGTLNEAQ